MTAEKPKPKQLLRPIATGTNSAMNQSQFLATELPETSSKRGKNHAYKVGLVLVLVLRLIGWKNWRESLKPITKRSNRNHVITFDSHLKTALSCRQFVICFTFLLFYFQPPVILHVGMAECVLEQTNVVVRKASLGTIAWKVTCPVDKSTAEKREM